MTHNDLLSTAGKLIRDSTVLAITTFIRFLMHVPFASHRYAASYRVGWCGAPRIWLTPASIRALAARFYISR